jgi:hypothetical protein
MSFDAHDDDVPMEVTRGPIRTSAPDKVDAGLEGRDESGSDIWLMHELFGDKVDTPDPVIAERIWAPVLQRVAERDKKEGIPAWLSS